MKIKVTKNTENELVKLRPFHATIVAVEKASSITYCEFVFVASGIQHTMRMYHILICGLPVSTIFFHIIS